MEKVQSGQLTAESPPLWNDGDPEIREPTGDDQITNSSDAEEDDIDTINDVLTVSTHIDSLNSALVLQTFIRKWLIIFGILLLNISARLHNLLIFVVCVCFE